LGKHQPLDCDANESTKVSDKFEAVKKGGQSAAEQKLEVVSCEIINYVLHEQIERVFAIVELKTIEMAREFMDIFQGILFKGSSLFLKPANKGLLVLYGVSETVSTSEIYSVLHSQFPYLK